MFEISGKYNSCRVFAKEIDSGARGQLTALMNQKSIAGSKIRIMPDCHAGAGSVIGTTMTIGDTVIPNLTGVDIGCGILVTVLAGVRAELPKLDSVIRKSIPAGIKVRRERHRYLEEIPLSDLRCRDHIRKERAALSLGTLGGGNHFIELDKGADGTLYLLVHSGSRALGASAASFYQEKAWEKIREAGEDHAEDPVPHELAYLQGDLLEDYLFDLRIIQEYASWNRRAIADTILREMKWKRREEFETVHNYIDTAHRILRKGAVSARKGERMVIPMNMRYGALICSGLGNPDWNESAPHGAGRRMTRSEARQSFTLSQFKKEMKGIYSSSVRADTLDESPMAYKPVEEILQNLGETVEVQETIRPVYNFKAGGGE